MEDRESLVRLVQRAIDEGATTVEEIHKSIADLPLRILEENDLLPETTKEVRRVQDHTIGAVYDLIRDINEKVGKLASDVLKEAAERRAPHRAARKKHAAGASAH